MILQINEQTMTVTVLPGPERRRRWTVAQKQRIVEDSLTAEMPIVRLHAATVFTPINYMAGGGKHDWDSWVLSRRPHARPHERACDR
jgi:hypothetical protein